MSQGFLLQSVASLVAVLLLVGLAAWARIARPCPPLDANLAKILIAEEFPDEILSGVWVSADGRAALSRAADRALIVFRIGDSYVARATPWAGLDAARSSEEEARVRFGEIGAPVARLKLPAGAAWPPVMEGLA